MDACSNTESQKQLDSFGILEKKVFEGETLRTTCSNSYKELNNKIFSKKIPF